jgi:hypothetical protein
MAKIHIHIGSKTKDGSTSKDFNSGISMVMEKLRGAKLPANPSKADIEQAKEKLRSVANDLDGLKVTASGIQVS